MSIAEKLPIVAENVPKVYDAGKSAGYEEGFNVGVEEGKDIGYVGGFNEGKQAEHDAFWDDFQLNGTRTHYGSAFQSAPITAATFSPIHDLNCTNCLNMFAYAGFQNVPSKPLKNLKEHLASLGVKLDTSQSTTLKQMFYTHRTFTHLPPISAESCTDLTSTFYNAYSIIEIEELILKEDGSNSFSDNSQYERTFSGCTALEEIRIRGMIGNSISFKDSTKLSRASIDSILDHLADYDSGISGKTLTLSQAAVEAAYPGGDWDDDFGLVTSVITNWTFVLV